MFTFLRNLSIIACILFLLIGGRLYHLRQVESTAYWLLLEEQFSRNQYIAMPNGGRFHFLHLPSNYSGEIYWSNDGNEIITSVYYDAIRRTNIHTGDESVFIPSIYQYESHGGFYIPDFWTLPDNRGFLVIVSNQDLDDIETRMLLYISTGDLSVRFISTIDADARRYLYWSGTDENLLFQSVEGIWYRLSLIDLRRQLATSDEIEHASFYGLTSPDRQSYIYLDQDLDVRSWFKVDVESGQQTKILESAQVKIDTVTGGTFQSSHYIIDWLNNDWLIVQVGKRISSGLLINLYYRMRPDGSELASLLDNQKIEDINWESPDTLKVTPIDATNFAYLQVRQNNQNILYRVDLDTLNIKQLLNNYDAVDIDNSTGKIFWTEIDNNKISVYQTLPDQISEKLFEVQHHSSAELIYNSLKYLSEQKNLLFQYAEEISPQNTIVIDLNSNQVLTHLNYKYISHSPLIDYPYHSKLPFLLSAWCGFMALLLATLPKVLDKRGVPC